ncbi:tRNA lysidine(34) synthetase TilS [Pseudomonas oryzihabitans]|uniref:tRNA(Ile)-lysidine synthase n=1 Tax=Pseudomonas oryzihabitans TaxID=47885 RepID=A0AAJ2BK97_9PSED|nr:tRNA lysidine(34) synthetase TilS [Pseudomonas psychrotolerans]MDR6235788.1 tRNA(Ile)-lysidine synthase [Pseudomonas psychrotolerans]
MGLLDRLHARLERQPPTRHWRVGFSGGLDSTVLLHLFAQLRDSGLVRGLSAVHVHHGLQSAADAWVSHCAEVCKALQVPLDTLHVRTDGAASLERAAREARYAAFARVLPTDGCLVLGQHRDDQLETLLLRLVRGAGVKGLAGMPGARSFAAGRLWRPLLDEPRAALLAYAEDAGLAWIEDPSNTDTHLDRNYLRHEVLPRLRSRWPGVAQVMARSAAHLAEADELLGELAALDLQQAQAGEPPFAWLPLPSLALAPLQALSEARQRNALRAWLASLTRQPDSAHWAGWQALRDSGEASDPLWQLEGGSVRRGAGRIWWVPARWSVEPLPLVVTAQANTLELSGNGRLIFAGEGAAPDWSVAYRRGGERFVVPGRGTRDLKRLLNERKVPPFLRGRLPLLWRGDELLAVANLPGLDGLPGGGRLEWLPTDGMGGFELG